MPTIVPSTQRIVVNQMTGRIQIVSPVATPSSGSTLANNVQVVDLADVFLNVTVETVLKELYDNLEDHIQAVEPHPAYDDMPSMTTIFENSLI